MNLWNIISVGLKEIWANKFRASLTMFGIVLGVSSLVAMSAVVKGMENGLREAFSSMGGLTRFEIEPEDDLPAYQSHLSGQAPGLRMRDVMALRHGASYLEKVNPSIDRHRWQGGVVITYKGNRTRPFMFSGTWPAALELREHEIAHGRMFNEVDNERARSVCVIGTGIRDRLFGSPREKGRDIVPIGEQVTIDGEPFTIVGMFKRYESAYARRQRAKAEKQGKEPEVRDHWAFRVKNRTVFIPLKTMQVKFQLASGESEAYDPTLSSINVQIDNMEYLEPALQQVQNILMVTHRGIQDFSFQTQEDWGNEVQTQIRNARMSRSMIASICLVVGGIGIMNIMLASISERVREIGIRKAIGATTGNVFFQVLTESVVIALIGGFLGLIVSLTLVDLITVLTPTDNAPIVTVRSMVVAIAYSVGIGIIAGLFPAFKASRLQPIQALRFEAL